MAIWSAGETPLEQQRQDSAARLLWTDDDDGNLTDYTLDTLDRTVYGCNSLQSSCGVSRRLERWPGSALAAGFRLLAPALLRCAQARSISAFQLLGSGSGNAAAFPYVFRSVCSAPVARAPARWRLALGRASERCGSRRWRAPVYKTAWHELGLLAPFSISWTLYLFFKCRWRDLHTARQLQQQCSNLSARSVT